MGKIAIITARGGSKRIPRKNIKDFLGKPILAYSIEAAKASGLFDEVMVSTDDLEIAEIARSYGAVVPFLRSEKTADDFATTSDVLIEVLETYLEKGVKYSHACCIYACAPFITGKILAEAYNTLLSGNYTCIFPYLSFGYPIWRSLTLNDKQQLEMIWPENINARSQDLPVAYHDAGQFYFFDVARFLETRNLLIGSVGGIHLEETNAQDIDTIVDWKLAEIKYQLFHQQEAGIR